MATYKVLQDIEAEDKLVGPFSLRQFIYAAIAAISAFIAFKIASVSIFLIAPFIPIIALFAVLSAPLSHDQSSEVWLLARVRFFLKPHKRIWNQAGMVNLVTITAPKRIQRNLTKNLTQSEVNSRLKALANTIDSRGWAVKNVNVNLSDPGAVSQLDDNSDRLVAASTLPQDVPTTDVTAADDIMDPASNLTAQHLDKMIDDATKQQHQQIIDKMNGTTQSGQDQTPDYWFMNNAAGQAPTVPAGYTSFRDDKVVMAGDDPSNYSPTTSASDDTELLQDIEYRKKNSQNSNGHMHVIEPLSEQSEQHKSATEKKPNDTSQTHTDL
jgi:hypothetical protein